MHCYCTCYSQESVVSVVTRLVDLGVESQHGQDVYALSKMSRPVLGPAQPPTQWVPGALSPGHEADHSHPSTAKVVNEWRYTCTPRVFLHGVNGNNFNFLF